MSQKNRRSTPTWQWEQALLDAYYYYRWRQVLDPLYEEMQRWKAGERTHDDIDCAIHETHKKSREVFALFTNKRDWLVRAIQFDRDWYEPWAAVHPPPPDE